MKDWLQLRSGQRWIALVFLALVVASAVAGVLAARSTSGTRPSTKVPATYPGELSEPAPWPANNGPELAPRLAAIGLPALAAEGTVLHIHQHLDVFVNGKRVVVPSQIGIDPYGRFISPLHTHNTTGVIHVESPVVRTFTLGEFMAVWGVRFGKRCLGSYCSGHGRVLRVYANGKPVADPQLLPLEEHEEIVIAYGTKQQLPHPLPSSYDFPPGL